jgi:hypothetical protein
MSRGREFRPAVEQIGMVSTDGGKTWNPAYAYIYRKQ